MRIGMIVDGIAEYVSIPLIFRSLAAATGHTFVNPTKADLQPLAPLGVKMKQLQSHFVLLSRKVDRVLVLHDRETDSRCPGSIAFSLVEALRGIVTVEVSVIVKDRSFENWLVADLNALRKQAGRFDVSKASERAVQPNKADKCNGYRLLATAVKGSYSKVDDAKRILGRSDISVMAENSRSFRRFLRCVGHPDYALQSKLP